MPRKHIWIAIPAYTGQIHVGTFKSILVDCMQFQSRGDMVQLHEQTGNAIISDCRSQMVTEFLGSKATHLVFVDSDVSWATGGMLRLVDHGVDVVAGMYPLRSDPIRFHVRSEDGKGLEMNRTSGLMEVWGAATGFMAISRKCLEKMTAHYRDELTFKSPNNKAGVSVGLFDAYRVPGTNQKLGEDYAFCQRWRDIGGKVWIDPHIEMGHTGLKLFRGQFGKFVQEAAE